MKRVLLFCLVIISCLMLYGCDDKEEPNEEFDEISYNMPEIFKKEGNYHYSRNYNYKDDDVYCYIHLDSNERGYYNEDKNIWFKGRINVNLNDIVSEVSEVDLGNTSALYVDVKDHERNTIDYYYGFVSSNHYYLLNIDISSYDRELDIKNSACYKNLEELLYSIKLK